MMYKYAVNLYDALKKESTDGIYSGKVVDTFSSLGISLTHYTPLFNALKELGSIEMLERGARGRPTRYRLHGRPQRKAFESLYLTNTPKPATIPLDQLEQRVSNIEGRLNGIDLKSVIVNFEQRLKKLEGGSNAKK